MTGYVKIFITILLQGLTIVAGCKLIIHWPNKALQKGMAYVMLGRCEMLEDIFIVGDFDSKGIHCSQIALTESARLLDVFKSMIETENQLRLKSFKVSYLNVRSLNAHFKDIENDRRLMDSDIFVAGETWINPDQDDVTFERFRALHLKVGRGRGISVFSKHDFQEEPTLMRSEKYSGVFLKCKGFSFIFLYLSQGLDQQRLLIDLTDLLRNKPLAIMGDMNWNYEDNTRMKRYLRKEGFLQLIKNPTHEQGGCLDQVYISKEIEYAQAMQIGTYYSDHDIVSLMLPK